MVVLVAAEGRPAEAGIAEVREAFRQKWEVRSSEGDRHLQRPTSHLELETPSYALTGTLQTQDARLCKPFFPPPAARDATMKIRLQTSRFHGR